jgi:hypothetical protein
VLGEYHGFNRDKTAFRLGDIALVHTEFGAIEGLGDNRQIPFPFFLSFFFVSGASSLFYISKT